MDAPPGACNFCEALGRYFAKGVFFRSRSVCVHRESSVQYELQQRANHEEPIHASTACCGISAGRTRRTELRNRLDQGALSGDGVGRVFALQGPARGTGLPRQTYCSRGCLAALGIIPKPPSNTNRSSNPRDNRQ